MSLGKQRFAFGEFILDADEKVLLKNGTPVSITPKVFQLLFVLVEKHGHIVEKERLMEEVWAGSFVEESNLTFSIRQLRKILGDASKSPRFIETVARRGYRFIARAEVIPSESSIEEKVPVSRSTPLFGRWFSGPVPVVLAVLLCAVVLSTGIFIWREGSRLLRGNLAATDKSFRFESFTSSDTPMTAAISPDGNYIAYSRTTNGRQGLWLRQLSSGVNTQIVAPEEGIMYGSVEFSPDSQFIYISRRLRNEPAWLDRVSILGGTLKSKILSDIDGAFSISPDDRHISFRRYTPQKRSLLIANIDGSDEHEIYGTEKTFTDNVFAPNGKTIAFASGQSDTGEQDFGVYTIDLDTGLVRPATNFRWVHVRSIAWLPDQSGLLATASYQASGPSQLWQISLADGTAQRVLNSQVGFASISATSDMSQILLVQVSGVTNLCLAASSKPDKLVPIADAAGGFAWTPEGGLVYSSPTAGNRDIWALSADKMTPKQLTVEDSIDFDPAVSPDGRYVVFVSDRAGKFNLWRINADGSNPVVLTTGAGEQQPAFTPNGAFVLFSSMKDVSLWKVSIDGGPSTEVSERPAYQVSVSPDGTSFAHFSKVDGVTNILIRSLENGKVVQQFDTIRGFFVGRSIIWSKDGKSVFYTAHDSNSVGNIWRQPLDGKPPKKITNYTSGEIFHFDFSPDNSELALVRGGWKYDAVLMKGFKQ